MNTCIKITKIGLFESKSSTSAIKAFGYITIGDPESDVTFTIFGIKIVEGSKGVFVSWPSRQSGDRYLDIVAINNPDYKKLIENKLIELFTQKKFSKPNTQPPKPNYNNNNYRNSNQRPKNTNNSSYKSNKVNMDEDLEVISSPKTNDDDDDIFMN